MKTPITLEDSRLTAYALGDLVEPGDVETIEAALKESPELQTYVDDIRDLGETLTLEFASETVPEEVPTAVSPKRSVWRYVAPLGIAAAIAVVATQLVTTEERADVSPEIADASVPASEESDAEMQVLQEGYEKARARMHELAQRHRIKDTELAAHERPELPNGSVVSLPLALTKTNSNQELGVSRKEMMRQLTEYREAKEEYLQYAAVLKGETEFAALKDVVVEEAELVALRKQNEEAKSRVEDLARRYRIVDLARLPKDEAKTIMESMVKTEPLENHEGPKLDPVTLEPLPAVSEEAPDYLFGWAAEDYQTLLLEAGQEVTGGEELSTEDVSDERQKYREYAEAMQVYERTKSALLAAEQSRSESLESRMNEIGVASQDRGVVQAEGLAPAAEAERSVLELETQQSLLAGLEGEALVTETLRLETSDPNLSALGSKMEQLRTKREEWPKLAYMDRHPKVQAIEGELAETKEMLVSAAESYRSTLNTELEMADRSLTLAKDIEEPSALWATAEREGATREGAIQEEVLLADGFGAGFGIGTEEAGDIGLAKATVSRGSVVKKANPGRRKVVLSPGKRPQFASGRLDDLGSAVAGESYAVTSDNAFKEIVNPGDERATFSTDVDTASYSNVRRFLDKGQLPPKDAVRVEEMINYFHYDYPQPEGEHPFSVNLEVNEAPWKSGHRLLRIGLKAKDVMVDRRPDSNLVFLVDVSGSMNSYDKLPLLKESLKAMVGGLTERDIISIVTYAGQSKVHLPPTSGHERDRLLDAIDQLQSGGSTNGASGIQMAYAQASKHRMANGVNRVLLATDGDFNVGVTNTDELISMAKKRAKEDHVFLTVLGFGQGNVQDARMEQLANKVDGSYHYIDSEREGRKVLVDEMSATLVPIAKDVKIQVEFNPAKVKSYRLIGYANRLLANRDFTDDKKDAGDMGAGHTVTAFYEVVPTGHENLGNDAAPLKYRRAKAVEPELEDVSADLVTVRLRYKEPKEDTSQEFEKSLQDDGKAWKQASEDFRFAASVAAFGMVIRQSPYCAASLSTIAHWAKESLAGDEYGWRAECVQLIEKAMKL